MARMVALLRGVNVGGRAKLAMADLRDITESCGCSQVRTYVQSGNVVFDTVERSPATVAAALEEALEAATGRSIPVAVRTHAQMKKVLGSNPFLDRSDDPTHHHVFFTVEGTGPLTLDGFEPPAYEPEEVRAVGRELYLFCPAGLGRSRLAADLAKRRGGPVGTMRNWRSVTALEGMLADRG